MSVFADYAAFYDIYYAGKDYDGECDFIEAVFSRFGRRPRTILDLACGTGNHGLRLSARGYQLTGVDRSAEMLAQYRQKAERQGIAADLHQQDLCDLHLDRQFEGAICMFDAIDYLPVNADLRSFLSRARAHLQEQAVFVFDFWHAVPLLRGYDPVRVKEFPWEGGRLLRISNTSLDIAQQVARVQFRVLIFEGDRLRSEIREVHCLRYFLPQEMAFILEATGWRLLHLCPAFQLDDPISEHDWHLVATASPTAS